MMDERQLKLTVMNSRCWMLIVLTLIFFFFFFEVEQLVSMGIKQHGKTFCFRQIFIICICYA